MKRLFVAALFTLALASCSAAAPAEPVVDETGFLELMSLNESSSIFTNDELLESGYSACQSAADQEISMSEARDNLIEYAIVEKGASEDSVAHIDALYTSAALYLCP